MQCVGAPGQHQIAEGQQRTTHGKRHRGHQQCHHQPALQPVTESGLVRHRDHGTDRDQPGQAQRAVAQPTRPPAGQLVTRLGVRRRTQQHRPQLGHLLGPHRIEPELALALGFLAGTDPQHRQAEQPVQQPGLGADRPDPVARQREFVALQHPAAQRELLLVDAVAGGEPAGQTQRHDQTDAQQRPQRILRGGPQHDRPDQQRQLVEHLVHGMDQQHARRKTLPARITHVASCPPSAAMSVSWATTWSATAASSATMRTAPAEDAVVTVTLARPNSRSTGPR